MKRVHLCQESELCFPASRALEFVTKPKRRRLSEDSSYVETSTFETNDLALKKLGDFKAQRVRSIRAKTDEEIKFLEEQFERDPTWNRNTVQICKKALDLKTHQIYKWGFDKKKRLERLGVVNQTKKSCPDTT